MKVLKIVNSVFSSYTCSAFTLIYVAEKRLLRVRTFIICRKKYYA